MATRVHGLPRGVLGIKLDVARWSKVLCFPRVDEAELARRVEELERLGVEELIEEGDVLIDGVRVLGKGCVGVVVAAKVRGVKAALKVRRVDADRPTLTGEARLLEAANSVGVGPRLLGATDNLLASEFIEGLTLDRWLMAGPKPSEVREVALKALRQCYELDRIGLDHGELSRADRHVIVRGLDPVIVDFESASMNRRPSNVTSMAQYLFIGGWAAKRVAEILGLDEGFRRRALGLLREYKRRGTRGSFEELLRGLELA